MKTLSSKIALLGAVLVVTSNAIAGSMTLRSNDISHGAFMAKSQEFQGFGCSGDDKSPHLSWSGAPKDTQAYAVFAFDPDAPTGSGWWHWQAVNIPRNVTSLQTGAGSGDSRNMPKGSMQMTNDYGVKGFGGACPPKGHGAHRYQFVVHALSQKLDLPENASAALTGYMINAHSLASATIEALYKR